MGYTGLTLKSGAIPGTYEFRACIRITACRRSKFYTKPKAIQHATTVQIREMGLSVRHSSLSSWTTIDDNPRADVLELLLAAYRAAPESKFVTPIPAQNL